MRMQDSAQGNSTAGPVSNLKKKKLNAWGGLLTAAVLSAYFYVFMEWLFYVTKPSFMDLMSLWTKLGILLSNGLLFAGVSLLLLVLLYLVSLAPWWSRHWKVFLGLGALIPAAFLAFTGLMLIDNFTYTVFQFGIVSTEGFLRGVYGLVFIALLVWFFRSVYQSVVGYSRKKRTSSSLRAQYYAGAGLLLLSVPFIVTLFVSNNPSNPTLTNEAADIHPNILLVGSDGLNAEHMSLYGYEKDTTPFLREFAQDALISQNNFPNATVTAGSLVSMFSSKLPTETRMLYPPDIVKGTDAFQHLPAILKKEGYYNADITVNYYGDSSILNLQDSFVITNERSATIGRLYTFSRSYLPEDVAYFLSTIMKRLSDRLFHIYYLRDMPNPYAEVNQVLNDMGDQDRVDQAITFFRNVQQPLFVHVHMMGTHIDNMEDYDDVVAEFDGYMHNLVEQLENIGELDETLIIVYTDHGIGNVSNLRVPLLFRFPNGELTGTLTHNTQNLDIAPTILDYIGIDPPEWMEGRSLLAGEPPLDRPIFSAAPNYRDHNEEGWLELDQSLIKPPFYQFGTIGMVVCQNWYAVNTAELTWEEAVISAYPSPCDVEDLPERAEAQRMMLDRLQTDGFDTSTLEAALRSGD
jgi:hypothetical protein